MGMISYFVRVADDDIVRLLDDPPKIHEFLNDIPYESPRKLDLDKTWGGVHFVLAGDAWDGEMPLGFIMHGPTIGEESVYGMGPALAKRASTVKEISAALESITEEVFRDRFDSDEMIDNEVYAMGAATPEEDLDYVLGGFVQLKEFVSEAASAGEGIIHYIT